MFKRFMVGVACAMFVMSAARAADQSTPMAAAKGMVDALNAGDNATVKQIVIIEKEEHGKLVDAMMSVMSGFKKFDSALTGKFGADAMKQVMDSNPAEGFSDLNKKLAAGKVKEEGDTATITMEGDEGEPMKLKKIDGKWKVDLAGSMKGESAAEMAKALPMFNAMGKLFSDLAADVTAGKYKTTEDVKKDIQTRMMAAIMGAAGASVPSTQPEK